MSKSLTGYSLNSLLINHLNPRFINTSYTVCDEIESMKKIIHLNQAHIVNLAIDISKNGLNPNEYPIITDSIDSKFLVMDGNRRLTALKLISQYADRLNEFGLNTRAIKLLNEHRTYNPNIIVNCYYSNDIGHIEHILKKLHTQQPGIGHVKWSVQSIDAFDMLTKNYNRRSIIIEFLKNSNAYTDDLHKILEKKNWPRKFEELFRNNESNVKYFGFSVNNNNRELHFCIPEHQLYSNFIKVINELSKSVNTSKTTVETDEVRIQFIENKLLHLLDRPSPLDKIVVFDSFDFSITNSNTTAAKKMSSYPYQINSNPQNNTLVKSPEVNRPPDKSIIKTPSSGQLVDNFNKSSRINNKLIKVDFALDFVSESTESLINEFKNMSIRNYMSIATIGFKSVFTYCINDLIEKRYAALTDTTLKNNLLNLFTYDIEHDSQRGLINDFSCLYNAVNNDLPIERNDYIALFIVNDFVQLSETELCEIADICTRFLNCFND